MTYAFQTPDELCFILDLMNGDDLHYHLSQHGVFSDENMKFYAAEVISGLEHMHKRFVVYRDLKPANILLDENGHIRISDLGLACDFSRKKPDASVGYMVTWLQKFLPKDKRTIRVQTGSLSDACCTNCYEVTVLFGSTKRRTSTKSIE